MNAPVLRDIPGYEGLYAVTREGDVWARARQWRTGRGGQIVRQHGAHSMRLFTDRRGYVRVNLKRGGNAKSIHGHRLVACAWIPNPTGLPQVNHIDGVKGHNWVENLEWCTASENKLHAHRTGLVNLDTDTFRASVRRNTKAAHAATRKLTIQQATEARRRVASGERKTNVAKDYGIAPATLRSILKGATYAE